jgi:hypothetical protein
MKIRMLFGHVIITGLTIGVAAAVSQAYFQVQPPEANGVCLIGHPAILTEWLMNNIFKTNLPLNQAFVAYPSMLAVGVVGGALAASLGSGEFRREIKRRPSSTRSKYMTMLFGFLVANFGLMLGACPIRSGLLVAYGSALGFIMLLSIITGVFLASIYLRRI